MNAKISAMSHLTWRCDASIPSTLTQGPITDVGPQFVAHRTLSQVTWDHPLAQSLTLSHMWAWHRALSSPNVGQDNRYHPSFLLSYRDQSRHSKRGGASNYMHALSVLDQAHTSNQ